MLNVACFVQSRLTDADFVIFSNYCLIGTRRTRRPFFCGMMAHLSPRTLEICARMLYTIKGAYAPERRPANETDYCNRAG